MTAPVFPRDAALRALTNGRIGGFPQQASGATTIGGRHIPLPDVHRCALGHQHCHSEACAEEAGIRAAGVSQEKLAEWARLSWCPACCGRSEGSVCEFCGRPFDPVREQLLDDTEPMLSAERDNREPGDL